MPGNETAPPHPLQLGQVLYQVQDSTLIYVPKGSSTARFQRVSFRGSQEKPEPVVHDPIDVGPMANIRDVRAVTHWAGGSQEVALLTAGGGISYIAMEDRKETLETAHIGTDVVLVIGLDPDQPSERVLALLAQDHSGFYVVRMDLGTKASARVRRVFDAVRLPSGIDGTALSVELVRRDTAAVLLLVVRTHEAEPSLEVHALDWQDLTRSPSGGKILPSTVSLGKVATDPSAGVNVAVVQMRPRSSDQQLALTWVDDKGALKLSLLGWGDDVTAGGGETCDRCRHPRGRHTDNNERNSPQHVGLEQKVCGSCVVCFPRNRRKFSELVTTAPDTAFAAPDRPVYRIVAADLLGRGVDQLVVGYPATYTGGKTVEGCAALMLFELHDPEAPTSELKLTNSKTAGRYIAANTDDQPLTSYDLRLGAGLFGSCFGIQVIGCGASMADLMDGQASVVCGFVGVNKDTGGLQPMPADGSVAQIVRVIANMDAGATMLAFPSDMSGKSVILGAPVYELQHRRSQILAFVQAPPYDVRTVADGGKPQVSISWTKGKGDGASVSSDDSYTTTKDLSLTLGFGDIFNLSTALHNSYGTAFSKTSDTSTSQGITFHSAVSNEDYVLQYEVDYDVWRYPVGTTSEESSNAVSDDVPAEVIVVIPHNASPQQLWTPANNFAYRPNSQVGMLLSYVNVAPEHYSDKNLLFDTVGSTVTTDTSTITYDDSTMRAQSTSDHLSVVNSLSGHVGMSAGTELFEMLPINFGINAGMSATDTKSKVDTTHVNNHTAMNLSVNYGVVKEEAHRYGFTPRIYQHAELGCLMLTWDVPVPEGGAWTPDNPFEDSRLTSPQVCMIRVYPDLQPGVHPFSVGSALSRSFYFRKIAGGKVDISIEVFNNGRLPAVDVSCMFYLGMPTLSYNTEKKRNLATLPEKKLSQDPVKLEGVLPGAGRARITLAEQLLNAGDNVTVQLFTGGMTNDDCIFYGVYAPQTVSSST